MKPNLLVGSRALEARRIAGLDLWRAVLMAAGLFVHGSLWLPPKLLFVAVGDASQAFRMGAFYAISGLLSALALERRDPTLWLRNRLFQLGIPAFCALVVFSPLIWYTVAHSRAAAFGWPLLPFEWHHLWFLFGLMLYSVFAVLLHRADSRFGLISRLDGVAEEGSGRVAILAVAALSACSLSVTGPLTLAILPRGYSQAFGNVQLISGYLPLFLLGFIIARANRLFDMVIAERRFCALLCAIVTAAYFATHFINSLVPLASHVRFIAATLCPPAAFAIILGSAISIRRVPAFLRHLSDASYTIYILHYPISVFINARLAVHVEANAAYVLSVIASGSMSFAFHVIVVQRSSVMRLLINGKAAPSIGVEHRNRACKT